MDTCGHTRPLLEAVQSQSERGLHFNGASEENSGKAGLVRAVKASIVLIGLAGISYGVLLASIFIRMDPLEGIVGTLKASPRQHADYHSLFLTIPSNTSVASSLRTLTMVPHVAGTLENIQLAEYVKSTFESVGLSSHYADYEVLLSYPIHRQLSITYPEQQVLGLKEQPLPQDPYSQTKAAMDTFHAYSPSGSVAGEVVYANYGRTSDFEELRKRGINCSGAIVLSRYGKIFRGDKVLNAYKAGGVASLVYSDPAESAGGGRQPTYPDSEYLPASGVQRGSIASFKGDPLTPGWPSVQRSERLDITDADLPPIPSLPISAADAEPIMRQLEGDVAPPNWAGALDLGEYRMGRGPVSVNLQLEMNLTVTPIRNVLAVIQGSEEPDRYVLLGNHRDAWTFGAADPNSGTSALIEVAKGLGFLLEQGWRPRRSIILANWDAEEYALIGSSEWAEDNEALLTWRSVAYLNVDVGVAGGVQLAGGASPQLDSLLLGAAKRVPDPLHPEQSLYDTWRGLNSSSDPKLFRLGGAGTDYAGFLQHLGVPSMDLSFSPEGGYPMYHTLYDDFSWMEKFGDPRFGHHVAIAQLWGLVALSLADDVIVPFDFAPYSAELAEYASNLDTFLASVSAPRTLSTEPIHSAVLGFRAAAQKIAQEVQEIQKAASESLPGVAWRLAGKVRELNDRLTMAERSFVSHEGLRGRPWFRHLIYAPSKDNGYGTSFFPGVADAVVEAVGQSGEDSWRVVQHEIHRVARAIVRASKTLDGSLA